MRIVLAALAALSLPAVAAPLTSGHYLKWDSDHTARQIRPVYPIDEARIEQFNTYRLTVEADRPANICYFSYGQPSNQSDFGGHCVQFSYDDKGITRHFVDTEHQRIANKQGVYAEYYPLDGATYPVAKQHLNQQGQLINNSAGIAEYRYKRDSHGRAYSEIRLDSEGSVVPEHNGFYEARFGFDNNDYATYRRGYDKSGHIMEGPKGYATAHFRFDKNGTFLQEEFRDANGTLVTGPSGSFARIRYSDLDAAGNWHKISLFDAKGQLLSDQAAIIVADYDDRNRRQSLRYFNARMEPAENSRGIARYVYRYDSQGKPSRQGFSLEGKPASP